MHKLLLTSISMVAVVSMVSVAALTQTEAEKSDERELMPQLIMEYRPDYYRAWLNERNEGLQYDSLNPSLKSLIKVSAQWGALEMPLSVCFFDGSAQARQRVKAAAQEWELANSSIQFAFSDGFNDTKQCDGEPHAIRISFRGNGVWSSLAREGNALPTTEPSMILGRFDRAGLDDGTFRRWVLHEFGHALGLVHEHQSPGINCMNEYKLESLKSILKAAPFNWNDTEIMANLIELEPEGLLSGGFDAASIMLYGFEPQYYKQGTASVCYHPPVSAISSGDKRFAQARYPVLSSGSEKLFDDIRSISLTDIYRLELDKTDLNQAEKDASLNAFKALLHESSSLPSNK